MNREPETIPQDNNPYSGPWLALAGLWEAISVETYHEFTTGDQEIARYG